MIGGIFILFSKGGVTVIIKAKTDFRDIENDSKLRKTGEQFEVSQERAEKLVRLDLVEIVTEKTTLKKKG